MKPSNIVVLGPTSSGKTDLANLIAASTKSPVFNCDAVQVYENLNSLTNKPKFLNWDMVNGERVSRFVFNKDLDFSRWENFEIKVYLRPLNKQISPFEFKDFDEFVAFLQELGLLDLENIPQNLIISNYLFDIRKPLEVYSILDFKNDLVRIAQKERMETKIIAGGTVYYAFNYILDTEFDRNFKEDPKYQETRTRLNQWEKGRLIKYIKRYDFEALKFLDTDNKVRLVNAALFIQTTGKKYSEQYFKKQNILEDFLLILLYPKDRKLYYKKLDTIVQSRLNPEVMTEIEDLVQNYGEKVKKWLMNISYEYRFALNMYEVLKGDIADIGCATCKSNFIFIRDQLCASHNSINPKTIKIQELISELQFFEHHYAKRQISFMRKLEKQLALNL